MKKIIAGLFCFMFFCSSGFAFAQELSSAPNFNLKDLKGKQYELAKYKGKKNVLLFFWTTWCPYCLQKIKMLNTESFTLERQGVDLLAVNAGESLDKVSRIAKNYNVLFNILVDPKGTTADSYGVMGVPTFVLIDKKGNIRYKGNALPSDMIKAVNQEIL